MPGIKQTMKQLAVLTKCEMLSFSVLRSVVLWERRGGDLRQVLHPDPGRSVI
jgi:CII-binding regulator of phage lambda lysogenization HflD